MPLIKFSLIIPTRARRTLLEETLRQLLKLDYPTQSFEVIVVENGPVDTVTKSLITQCSTSSKLRLSYLQTLQMGASVARNAGLTKARYQHVIFLDDDLIIPRTLLLGYDRAWKKYPQAELIGGKVTAVRRDRKKLSKQESEVLESNDAWCLGATMCGQHDEELFPGGALVSANMSYHQVEPTKELFNPIIGRPFTRTLQFGSEDYELCQRFILSQQKVMYVSDPDICVANRVTPERFQKSYLHLRYWLHGMEMACVERILLNRFPNSLPVYRGFLWWDLTHWPNVASLAKRFLTNKNEWIRLFSYLLNGRYLPL